MDPQDWENSAKAPDLVTFNLSLLYPFLFNLETTESLPAGGGEAFRNRPALTVGTSRPPKTVIEADPAPRRGRAFAFGPAC